MHLAYIAILQMSCYNFILNSVRTLFTMISKFEKYEYKKYNCLVLANMLNNYTLTLEAHGGVIIAESSGTNGALFRIVF